MQNICHLMCKQPSIYSLCYIFTYLPRIAFHSWLVILFLSEFGERCQDIAGCTLN